MREIKFRGKRFVGGVWEIGCYLQREGNYGETLHFIYDGEHEHLVHPETVGQYTNVHSWHERDNDIYSGDILELIDENNETFYASVEMEGPGFLLVSDHFDEGYVWMHEWMESNDGKFWIPGAKIVGTIHTHPHFLKGE